ncbi:MAG: DedA family protein [Nanoarchaeota archaeon]
MSFTYDALASMAAFAIATIDLLGYGGIIVLMALESMITPLPSELVMPFAGFLAFTGRFNIWLVILASGIGSLIGSWISYAMGRYGGHPLVMRFGHYVFYDAADLKRTEDWFARSGEKTIFISRFIPVVRHFISIPAGMAKMNLVKFSIYTFVGATLWNAILAYLGYALGERWELVRDYAREFSHVIAIVLAIVVVIMVYRHVRHKHVDKIEKGLVK